MYPNIGLCSVGGGGSGGAGRVKCCGLGSVISHRQERYIFTFKNMKLLLLWLLRHFFTDN